MVNTMTGRSDSCLHVTPQVVHSFGTMECHSKQSSTEEPAIVSGGYLMCLYAFCCRIFSAAAKKKKDMIFVGLISRANGKLRLHTVKALHLQVILKSIIIVITAICIISTSHRLCWVIEILVIKGCNSNLSNQGEVSFRLDTQWIFTQVQPRLYWGSPSVSGRRSVNSPLRASHWIAGNWVRDRH